MSVGGSGVTATSAAAIGSPEDLAAVIKDDAAYKLRLDELKAQHAKLDEKIALAGHATDVVRLRREAIAAQNEATLHLQAAKTSNDKAAAELGAARVTAADIINTARGEARTQAQTEAAEIISDARIQTDLWTSEAASKHTVASAREVAVGKRETEVKAIEEALDQRGADLDKQEKRLEAMKQRWRDRVAILRQATDALAAIGHGEDMSP